MLSANFKPKRTVAASHGFLATARLSCLMMFWSEVWTFMTGQPTNLKVGLERYTIYELSDFARVGAPYLHSAYVKDYNTIRNEKNMC